MQIFPNPLNLDPLIVHNRLSSSDPQNSIEERRTIGEGGQIVSHFMIDSTLTNQQITDALSTPHTVAETNELTTLAINKATLREQYQAAIDRLSQIENAGAIPFTQAGFKQVVQAVKDEAKYIRYIAQAQKRLLT